MLTVQYSSVERAAEGAKKSDGTSVPHKLEVERAMYGSHFAITHCDLLTDPYRAHHSSLRTRKKSV